MTSIVKLSFKKLIIIILILVVFLAMVVFGVNRYNNSSNPSYFIKVGDISIPTNLFLSEYKLIIQQNSYILSQNPYLLSNVLQGMISRYVSTLIFANEANNLNIGASEKLIYRIISNTPYFQDKNHKFDKELFKKIVTQTYESENNYLNTLKNDIKQTQLTGVLVSSLYLPNNISKYFIQSLSQARTIEYVIFSRKDVKNLGTPTNSELLNLRDNNKDLYTVPEFRSLSILEINPLDNFANKTTVSDKEINEYYATHKNNFLNEETRDISEILLNTEEEANKLYLKIKNKTTLEDNKYKVTTIKNVNKNSLPDEISKVIFNSQQGVISKPIKTDLGYHLVVVNKINRATPEPLNKVKSRIYTIISSNKLANEYENLKNKLTNEVSNNKTLHQLQQEFKSNLIKVSEVNKFGFDKKNNILNGPAQNSEILNTAFNQPLNAVSNVIIINNKFYVVETTNIFKEYLRSVEEAKDDLTKQWKYNKSTEIIKNKAEKFIETFNSKQSLNKLNVKINQLTISRNKSTDYGPFKNNDLDQIFLTKINSPIEGILDNGDIYVVITKKIINNLNNNLTKEELNHINEYISGNFKEDALTQLFSSLSEKYKVDVNKKAIENILGNK